jgi:hypothetical protein
MPSLFAMLFAGADVSFWPTVAEARRIALSFAAGTQT